MSFEDDMIEYGFTDSNDYLDFLYEQEDERYNKLKELESQWQESDDSDWEDINDKREERKERRRNKEWNDVHERMILMCWIKENPEKARIWYAHFSHSTEIDNYKFNNILEPLIKGGDEFISSLSKMSVDDAKFEYLYLLKECYHNWKEWILRHYEYEDFKKNFPTDWNNLYMEFINKHIRRIIGYRGLDYEFLHDFDYSVINTYRTYDLLQYWIKDNGLLWDDICSKFSSDEKSENDYLRQAWLDNFEPISSFEIWKEDNKQNWKYQLNNLIKKSLNNLTEDGLYREFIKENRTLWDSWIKKNFDTYQIHLKEYNDLLWYAYTETLWIKNLEKIDKHYSLINYRKKIAEESVDEELELMDKELGFDEEDLLEWDSYETDEIYDRHDRKRLHNRKPVKEELHISIFQSICNREQLRDKQSLKNVLLRYFNDYLNCNGILESNKDCTENEKIRILIDNYYTELNNNSEKKEFIKSNCNESDIKDELYQIYYESPEEYANKRLMELWIAKHEYQWEMWVCRHCWNYMFCSRYSHSSITYSLQKNYDVWTKKHQKLWSSWLSKNFTDYKSKVKAVDLWYLWLEDDDNCFMFGKWAKSHIKTWNDKMHSSLLYDFEHAYEKMFGLSMDRYTTWRETCNEEWSYWKKNLIEEILIDNLDYYSYVSYKQEYKLRFLIDETRYRAQIGDEVFHNNLALISFYTKYGYINKEGKIVIPLKYDYALDFRNNMALVVVYDDLPEVNNELRGFKCGIIDTNGVYIKEPQYDCLSRTNNNLFIFATGGIFDENNHCYKDSKWGIMNDKFEILADAKYSSVKQLGNQLFVAGIKNGQNEKFGLLSKEAKELSPFKYSHIYDSGGKLMEANIDSVLKEDDYGENEYRNGLWGYLTIDGKEKDSFIPAHDINDFYDIISRINY